MIAMIHKNVANFANKMKPGSLANGPGVDAIGQVERVFDSFALFSSRLASLWERLDSRMWEAYRPVLFHEWSAVVPNSVYPPLRLERPCATSGIVPWHGGCAWIHV